MPPRLYRERLGRWGDEASLSVQAGVQRSMGQVACSIVQALVRSRYTLATKTQHFLKHSGSPE